MSSCEPEISEIFTGQRKLCLIKSAEQEQQFVINNVSLCYGECI